MRYWARRLLRSLLRALCGLDEVRRRDDDDDDDDDDDGGDSAAAMTTMTVGTARRRLRATTPRRASPHPSLTHSSLGGRNDDDGRVSVVVVLGRRVDGRNARSVATPRVRSRAAPLAFVFR